MWPGMFNQESTKMSDTSHSCLVFGKQAFVSPRSHTPDSSLWRWTREEYSRTEIVRFHWFSFWRWTLEEYSRAGMVSPYNINTVACLPAISSSDHCDMLTLW